jgi:hypothetical protein
MTDLPYRHKRFTARAADRWAVALVTVFIVLIVAGLLPGARW